MTEAHRLLREQLERFQLTDEVRGPWAGFVAAVDQTYTQMDDYRGRAERGQQDARVRRRLQEGHTRVLVGLARGMADYWGDLDAATRRITEVVGHTLDVERTSVWLFEQAPRRLRCVQLYEKSLGTHSSGTELDAASYPEYTKALEFGRFIAAHDAQNDPATKEFTEGYLAPLGITSMLDATVRGGGELVGVVCHEHVGPKRVWTSDEQAFAGAVADLITLVIESCRRKQVEDELGRQLTERIHAEDERVKLEANLRQAQRLESLGLLAGGISHDFNNLLTPIIGYTDSALAGLDVKDPLREDLEEILRAARRACELTAQLMAFGRRQVLEVRPTDLNEQILSVQRMLSRLMPESVEIELDLAKDLGLVRADPTQIQQVIVNLAVNARDAMPTGGRLTIRTMEDTPNDTAIDEASIKASDPAMVCLCIEDTGQGMDAATAAQIFEPFFTTKDQGHGTGLGLATVHGIVSQHGGSIAVRTEPNRGTVFRLTLPRAGADYVKRCSSHGLPAVRGSETILVVEDEDLVRRLVERVLTEYGYSVLSASSLDDALAAAAGHAGVIDLLLTDVVLPRGDGTDVHHRLCELRPGTKVLYMSGHAQDILGCHGIVGSGVPFLKKPFSSAELMQKVSEALSGE